jgi:hypothetical protein
MSLQTLPPVIDPGNRIAGMPDPVESAAYGAAEVSAALFGEGGPSFRDLVAAINPLQHLPVIGTIYRHLTGDTISPGSRLAGGLLYGGPLGLLGAAANAALEGSTGKDLGDHVLAMVVDPKTPAADPPVLVASAAPTPAAQPEPVPTPSPVGPTVAAHPVTPVVASAAPAAAPRPANDALTPEAYARAMAAAHGRNVAPFPVRGGAPVAAQVGGQAGGQAGNAVQELTNEEFARLLGAFEPAAGKAAEAISMPQSQPVPVPVPMATGEYRPSSRNNPYITRGTSRYFPAVTR